MEHKTTTSDLVIGGAVILILSISPFWILATNIDSDEVLKSMMSVAGVTIAAGLAAIVKLLGDRRR